MARILTTSGTRVNPKGQPSLNECWLTAYEMLFNSGGEYYATSDDIKNRLNNGGFGVETSVNQGLLDEDFLKMSQILNTGALFPRDVASFSGMSQALQNYGVLWLALQIKNPKGPRFHHIVIALGTDQEHKQIGIVNPWKENDYDLPSVTWRDWDWMSDSIKFTQNLEAGCQYFRKTVREYDER